jgi:hypothetical protein
MRADSADMAGASSEAARDFRVIEIGVIHLFAGNDQLSQAFRIVTHDVSAPRGQVVGLRLRDLPALIRDVRGDRYDAILLYPMRRAPWNPDLILRVLGRSW